MTNLMEYKITIHLHVLPVKFYVGRAGAETYGRSRPNSRMALSGALLTELLTMINAGRPSVKDFAAFLLPQN